MLHYTSWKQITDDIDDARIFGGVHYRFDQETPLAGAAGRERSFCGLCCVGTSDGRASGERCCMRGAVASRPRDTQKEPR